MAAAWRGANAARNAAESRLAAATALLEDAAATLDDAGLVHTAQRIRDFLSATPAQAAEPTAADLERIPVGALVLPPGVEHPDTIALRRCRAELESAEHLLEQRGQDVAQYKEALESARAERDTALEKRHEAIQEQARLADGCNAALARIAELEAQLETTRERAQWDLDWRIEAEALTRNLDMSIARAVAELEKAKRMSPGRWVEESIDAALEALR
jgi:hypothetical protein